MAHEVSRHVRVVRKVRLAAGRGLCARRRGRLCPGIAAAAERASLPSGPEMLLGWLYVGLLGFGLAARFAPSGPEMIGWSLLGSLVSG